MAAVDFIKLSLPRTLVANMRQNEKITVKSRVDLSTGEVSAIEEGVYYSMRVVITPKQYIVSGSLHKFFNEIEGNGKQNFDDFTRPKQDKAILRLCQEFNFTPEDATIQNMEFGVNVPMDISPEEFLKKNLVSFYGVAPSLTTHFNKKGYYREFTKSQYYLKVYSKSKQHNLDTPLLRIEVKTRKSEIVGKYGIIRLSDLLELRNLQMLRHELLEKLNHLLIVDSLDFRGISNDSDREFITRYINPQMFEVDEGTRRKQYLRDKLRQLLGRYGYLNQYEDFCWNVSEKCDELLSVDSDLYV